MTVEISQLPMLGDDPAMDLVNTVTPRVPTRGWEPYDHLVDPAALLVWAQRAAVLDTAEAKLVGRAWRREAGSGQAALTATREVREALHDVLLALSLDTTGTAPTATGATAAALQTLHGRWINALGRGALVPARGGPHGLVSLDVGMAPSLLVPDRVAVAAVELVRTVDVTRLRRCPPDEGGCGWVLLDHSRNGSRRWCRMADCGTEVKARRLTERRRAARSRLISATPVR